MQCRGVERKVGSMLVAVALLMLMASGAAQAATTCDAPIGALVHGASTSVTDSTTSPTLTSGSATATCNNGTLVYTSTSCLRGCPATTVNWGAGCTASAAALLSGGSANLTNTNPAYGGTVTSSCTNGVRSSSSAVCAANCTIPAGQTWVVGANTCTNPTAFTIAHGANGSGTDATQPTTGTGTWSCTNGAAALQGTSTCYAQCAAQAVNWSQAASNCTGTSAVLNHGGSDTISDSTAPAIGNVNITCNNGVLNQSSLVCDGTNSCAAGTVNWVVGGRSCSASVLAGIHGSSQALTDSSPALAPNGSGGATATCTNGAWITSAETCVSQCSVAAGTAWTVSSNTCNATAAATINHGSTGGVSDSVPSTTGAATYSCTNGTATIQAGATCTAGPPSCSGYVGSTLVRGPEVAHIEGTKLVLSNPVTSINGSDLGDIRIYDYDTMTQLHGPFFSPSGGSDDEFGDYIDFDGTYLIASDNERNRAHIFNVTSGVRTEYSLSSTNYVAIDAPYAAVRNSSTLAILNAPAATLRYTLSGATGGLDMNGTDVLTGWTNAAAGGEVRLYNASTGGLVRTFANPTPASGDAFGALVAMSGNYVVVSAPRDDTIGTDKGAIYVFNKTTGALLRTITNADANIYAGFFPQALVIDGDNILVGVPYYTYGVGDPFIPPVTDTYGYKNGVVFAYSASTGALMKTIRDDQPLYEEYFGRMLAIDGARTAIGSWFDVDTETGGKGGAIRLGSCGLPGCRVSQGTMWAVGGTYCTATNDVNIAEGATTSVTDTTAPQTGTSNWQCSGGNLTLLAAGKTCTGTYPSGSWNQMNTYPYPPDRGGDPDVTPEYIGILEMMADGRVLMMGGMGPGDWEERDLKSSVYIFDPNNYFKWTIRQPMPSYRNEGTAALLGDGRVLFCGGMDACQGSEYSACWSYNAGTNTWASHGNMPTPRKYVAVTTLNDGKAFMCGGLGGGAANDGLSCSGDSTHTRCDTFNPATNTFSSIAPMPAPTRYAARAETLLDGRVLMCGGYDGTNWYNQCHLYTPGTNTWAAAAPLPVNAATIVFHRTPSGKVLSCGGTTTGQFSRCDLYNPATNTWTQTADVPRATPTDYTAIWRGMRSARMGDGRIMICRSNWCYAYSE